MGRAALQSQWREPLTRQRIIEAAIALIDGEGSAALTVVRLGAELGVTDMALYKHFPSKGAILDGVVEYLLGTVEPLDPREDAEAGLARLYSSLWRLFRAHPNALAVLASRPLTLPTMLDYNERGLAVLTAAGASADEARVALRTLTALTLGFASLAAGGYLEATAQGRGSSGDADTMSAGRKSGAKVDIDADFERSLTVVLASVKARLP